MIQLLQILAIFAGAFIVIYTFLSATSTFVLPRSASVKLTTFVFGIVRKCFKFFAKRLPTYEQKDSLMALYAPLSLLLLVPTWLFISTFGYALIFWGMGITPFNSAFLLSGSSILTLGFSTANTMPQTIVAFSEATIGIILVAMLISYLPTMYSAWSKREGMVSLLEVRAGMPPTAFELVWRLHGFQNSFNVNDFWSDWEQWFNDIDESHTTLAALVYFRSARPTQSWVHAAGVVLDGAALYLSVLKHKEARFLPIVIRAGVLALRHMADLFQLDYPATPTFPHDPIAITRKQFNAGWDILAGHGVALVEDQDVAWQNFAGWRVNYDATLLALRQLTMSPEFDWLPKETFVPATADSHDTGGQLQKVSLEK